MTQYIVRLATADDRPAILRLQEQFIAELARVWRVPGALPRPDRE